MFSVRDLQQFYNPSYFGINKNQYIWKDRGQTDPNALASVEFIFQGGTISYVKSNLLKEMKDAYRTDSTKSLNLRKICDGLLFLDRVEEHYLIILEVKSGFKEVKNKAIGQIPASYIKAQSILNDFSSFNMNDYKAFGLIISYPFIQKPPTDAENNPLVWEDKQIMTGDIFAKYNRLLRNHQKADFIGIDFGFDKLTQVKQDLLFDKLKVRHYPVNNHCVNAEIDLDVVIGTL
jgi:hypothetical protein